MAGVSRAAPVLLTALVAAAGSASAGPRSGVLLTPTQVGPLRLGVATMAQMVAFAGKPDRAWQFAGRGQIPADGLFLSRARAFGYGCNANGCRTVYAFTGRTGRLLGLYTRAVGFHTRSGTHVGTGLTQALLHEKQVDWAGFAVQCPSILFPSSGTTEFKANVTRTPPRVSSFLLTLSPQLFSDGC